METDAICNDTENNRHSRRVADRLGATIDLNLQNRLLPVRFLHIMFQTWLHLAIVY